MCNCLLCRAQTGGIGWVLVFYAGSMASFAMLESYWQG